MIRGELVREPRLEFFVRRRLKLQFIIERVGKNVCQGKIAIIQSHEGHG